MGKVQKSGHVQEYVGIDPKTGKEIWTYAHRKAAGVGVGDKAVVHHKDSNPGNNSRSNLQVVADRTAHNKIDKKIQKGKK